MSLFLEERMKEQTEDAANDNIVFTYPWIVTIDPRRGPDEIFYPKSFTTSYYVGFQEWGGHLWNDQIQIGRAWNGSSCFISYNLFYDNDMRFLLHSSPRTKMIEAEAGDEDEDDNEDAFRTPDEFLSKFIDAVTERKVLKVVFYVELHLPLKWFYRPFDNPNSELSKKACEEYPQDLENDYKFAFLKTSDFSIKCSDGAIPASKMLLNVTSKFMMKHFKKSKGNELTLNYPIDAVKPVIYYLHTLCFEMPTSYDTQYAKSLLEVIDFFQPVHIIPIRQAVHQSLCRKFVEKTAYTFHSLLLWLSIASRYQFYDLAEMISSLIAGKYYFKWHQLFPENARNDENPYFRQVFGSRVAFRNGIGKWVFSRIEGIIVAGFQCKAILP